MKTSSLLLMLMISLTGFSQSVYDFISNSPNHTTLTAAIDAAGLEATLSGPGTFTVFAPDDNAFAALPAGVVDELLLDPAGDLTTILTYHVLGSVALSSSLSDGQMVETLQGESVTVTIDGNVFINEAQVTGVDFEEPNGVVHVINGVLLPQAYLLPETVVEIVVDSPDHETLEAAVIAAELADDLSGAGPFTVFAPTDDAFAALGTLVDDLLLDPTGDLATILLYHVLGAEVFAEDITDGIMPMTLQGEDMTINIVDGAVIINGTAEVFMTNLQAQNGVVHVIDAVLLPPSFLLPETVVDIIVDSPDHETLEAAVIAAELADDLSGDGPFTVFAPTDEAFAALGTLVDDLLLDPTGDLATILLYHVLGAEVFAEDITDGIMPMTLQGEDMTINIVDGAVIINGTAEVFMTNLQAQNGVVHVIDAVLLPPSFLLPETVVDIIVDSPDHETLEAAVIAAELADDLSGDGPFTVFAPTDEAFAALGTLVDELLLDPTGDLATILLYHVLGAEVLAEDITDGIMPMTLQGEDMTINIVDGAVIINGTAEVFITNLQAQNGVVHVIDAVLLPPSFLLPETVVDIIVDSPDHETLEAAVIAAELADDLSGDGPFTVFAPTDEAFAALGTLVDELLLDPTGDLATILLYHVLGAEVFAEDITDGIMPMTLQGEDMTINIVDGAVIINGTAEVFITNLQAQNGVVHVIDAVLLPPSFSLPETVVDIIVDSPDHTILEVAVVQAELADDLSGEGPFTVFAPTDEAFSALPAGTVEELLMDPTGDLAQILLYHVLGAEVFAEDITDGIMPMTLQGEDMTINIVDGAVIINGTAEVFITNLQAQNGVVHVIDAVLLPPSFVGVEEFENAASAGLKVGPNPASDFFNIQFPAPLNTNAQVMIYDLNGRLVKTEVVRDIFSQVSTSGLSEGSYIMTIVSGDMNFFQKVMIAK